MHNTSSIITGTCVSPGKVSGTIRVYQKDVQYVKDDIVLLNEWVTTNVAYLKDAGGLISFRGGITCHASIIAREYGLPCLVAVAGGECLKEGARVTLDATNEIIDIV